MATKLNIIVIEDHDALREMTVDGLLQVGHHVIGIDCAEALAETQRRLPIDLMIIDLNLPGEDGISLARRLRETHPHIGIIMLTARDAMTQKMEGYDSGADLYLTKPTSIEELNSAINALSRRLKQAHAGDSLVLDNRKLRLSSKLASVDLTKGEAATLEAFTLAPGLSLETWQLAEALSKPIETSRASLEMQITRLRKKIMQVNQEPQPIKAIRQQGYQLCVKVHIQ